MTSNLDRAIAELREHEANARKQRIRERGEEQRGDIWQKCAADLVVMLAPEHPYRDKLAEIVLDYLRRAQPACAKAADEARLDLEIADRER